MKNFVSRERFQHDSWYPSGGHFWPKLAACEARKTAAKSLTRRRYHPPNSVDIASLLQTLVNDPRFGHRILLAAASILGG
jgi:hypothetical protein